ncbi:Cysteine protease atg4b [Podila epigama]|nr:Cysteine protease atg4b [Podila epigama]
MNTRPTTRSTSHSLPISTQEPQLQPHESNSANRAPHAQLPEDETSPSRLLPPATTTEHDETSNEVPSPLPSPDYEYGSSLVHIPSHGKDDDGLEPDSAREDEQTEALYLERFTEEPDAGEHFMQATSEFFSKMGYWLYNSRVVQYIARDDPVLEQVCALPEQTSSRKGSQHHTLDAKQRTASTTRLHSTPATLTGPVLIGARSGFGTASEGKGPDRRRPHGSAVVSPLTETEPVHRRFPGGYDLDLDGRHTRNHDRTTEKHLEKEQEKARKAAMSHERKIEKELIRAREKEEAKERDRLRHLEKQEKLIDRPLSREKVRDKDKEKDKDKDKDKSKDKGKDSPPTRQHGTAASPGPIQSGTTANSIAEDSDRAHVGLGLQFTSEPKESKQGVVRRMRSMSILHKVPSALDLLASRKTGMQEPNPSRMIPVDRPLQMRSHSISNLSVLTQKSATSSSASYNDSNNRSSPPGPSSLKASISVREALETTPKQSVLSKLAHLNLSQKKLVAPPSFDDLPDIPVYNVQEAHGDNLATTTALSPTLPLSATLGDSQTLPHSTQEGRSPHRRRMTISGIFAKDPKPSSSSSSLTVLKSLVSSRSPPRTIADTPSRMDGPPHSFGPSGSKIAFAAAPSLASDIVPKKGSMTRNMQSWLERRLSSNTHMISSAPSMEVPVSRTTDLMLSPSTNLIGNNGNPEVPTLSDATTHLKPKPRSRKQSSLFSSASSLSPSVNHLNLATKTGAPSLISSRHLTPSNLDGMGDVGLTAPVVNEHVIRNTRDVSRGKTSDTTIPNGVSGKKVPLKHSRQDKDTNHASSVTSPTELDGESFVNLVILPPLPPESPTEAFVLLEKEPETPTGLTNFNAVESSAVGTMEDDIRSSSFVCIDPAKSVGLLSTDSGLGKGQSQEIYERIAAFSNEKTESMSDLQLDWESLWPGKRDRTVEAKDSADGSEFVHVQESKIIHSDSHALESRNQRSERPKNRKTSSSFVKVKGPSSIEPSSSAVPSTPPAPPEQIVAPQAKSLVPLQSNGFRPSDVDYSSEGQTLGHHAPRDRAPPIPRKKQSLDFPSIQTNIPRHPSPNSPGLALSQSWRAISSRPNSPRLTQPLTSDSCPTSAPQQTTGTDVLADNTPGDSIEIINRDVTDTAGSTTSSLTVHSSFIRPDIIEDPTSEQRVLQKFIRDFQTRIWFTYRKDISRIEPSFYTSDAGWGCMMRTGQSLLAEAFVQIMLGRDWRAASPHTAETRGKYRTLLSWFVDEPDRYYSIHNIAKSGLALDKRVGDWFGPSTMAHALKQLSQKHHDCPAHISVIMDNTIRASEVAQTAMSGGVIVDRTRRPSSPAHGSFTFNGLDRWKPVILLLPSRFGLEKLTEKYIHNLKKLFELPQFLGIAGGRPQRSLYFVACQGNELFYLDPHFSYHCHVVRTMDIQELDPSMMLGFLIRSQDDLLDLNRRLKSDMQLAYPLVTIVTDIALKPRQRPESMPGPPRPAPRPQLPPEVPARVKAESRPLLRTIQAKPRSLPKAPVMEENKVSLLSLGAEEPVVVMGQTADSSIVVLGTEGQEEQESLHSNKSNSNSNSNNIHTGPPTAKELKRIAKALKKEQKLMKVKEKEKEKKRAKEQQHHHMDPYVYRYTSHDGDHIHDQDTLSVKSLNSDTSF